MTSNQPKILSKRLRELGVLSFLEAITFIKKLPYGRNSDRSNPDLVLEELKGTCSTKHAVLRKIAAEQSIGGVRLLLCMFKMNAQNTPKVEDILGFNDLEYIPEAHCILEINGHMIDVTNADSDFSRIQNDVIEMFEIQPKQIGNFKLNHHRVTIEHWRETEGLSQGFEELWMIREQCIKALEG